jgi:hypothetical protein
MDYTAVAVQLEAGNQYYQFLIGAHVALERLTGQFHSHFFEILP